MRNLLALVAVPFMASPVVAQDWNNLAASEAMNQVHATMRQHMIVNPAEETETSRSPRAGTVSRIDPSYPINPAVRRGVEQNLVAAVARQNRAAGEELSATFARHDLIAMVDRALSAFGLRSGNVIDAVTIYRLGMWGAAKDLTTPPPRTSITGARRQVASTFDLAGAGLDTPVRRQQFAETLLYQAVLFDLTSEEAHKTKNQAAIRDIQLAARKALIDSGIDPDRSELTAAGFTRSR
jgi:hypothetical protein